MIRSILIYGVIAGVIVMIPTLALIAGFGGLMGGPYGMLIGYLTMIVALSAIFVGVKRYRDEVRGGVIKFLPALLMGLGISVVAGVMYVAAWEVYLNLTDYAFMDGYARAMIDAAKAKGVAGPELDKLVAEMNKAVVDYRNPLYRLPTTFAEIFPVGVLISLVVAGLLRSPRFMPARNVGS
jgi:hypothetical protein